MTAEPTTTWSNSTTEAQDQAGLNAHKNVLIERYGGQVAEITIASAIAIPTKGTMELIPEGYTDSPSVTSDTLNMIDMTNHPVGRFITVKLANASTSVTLKHNTGSPSDAQCTLQLADDSDITLSDVDTFIDFYRESTNVLREVRRYAGSNSASVSLSDVTAGETIADRDLVYLDIFNQQGGGTDRWYLVDTDATGPVAISPVIGMALSAAASAGNTFDVQTGLGTVTGLSGLTAGQPLYASTTAGGLTHTPPAIPSSGNQVATRLVGYALSTSSMWFNPTYPTTFTKRSDSVAVDGTVTVEHYEDDGALERRVSVNLANDTTDSNTLLLLHGNGTDGATSTTDESDDARTVTFSGDAQLDTGVKKFGTASFQFDGTGDYISVPDSDDWAFSGDFTIEAWVRFDTDLPTGLEGLCGQRTDNQNLWELYYDGTGNGLTLDHWVGNSKTITLTQGAETGWAADTLYHVAFERDGNTFRLYRDGTVIASASDSDSWGNFTGALTFGVSHQGGVNRYFDGWLDEIRVSNVARYGGAFTAPSAEFTTALSTRWERVTIGGGTVDASASDKVLVTNDDGTGSDPETKTTFKNRTGGTRDLVCDVVL